MATESEVRNALGKVQDPELGQSIVDLGMVRDLQVADGKGSIHPGADQLILSV